VPSHLRRSGTPSRLRTTFGACFVVRSAHRDARVHRLLQLVVGRRSLMDVSRRRAGLVAESAQTTGFATHGTVRAGLPPHEVGAAPRNRRARRWSSCCRRLSCVASLTDEWSTETQHNIALGNQVKSPASIAGKALPPSRQPDRSQPSAAASRSRCKMAKRVTQAKSDPTMLLLLAASGIVGLLVIRRYGVVPVLRTLNHALGIARVVRSAQPTRRRRARRVRPKVLGFSRSP
jgi:hypothetical protein